MAVSTDNNNITKSKLRQYLMLFKGELGDTAQKGVLNCLRIIDHARDGDLSNEDFSMLDMRLCSFAGRDFSGTNFSESQISHSLFFPQGHTDIVCSIDFSPCGGFIITASEDNMIMKWNIETEELSWAVASCPFPEAVLSSAHFSPCGRFIVAASSNSITIHSSETGKLIRTLEDSAEGSYKALYGQNGRCIVAISRAYGASTTPVKVWNSDTGRIIHILNSNEELKNCLSISPCGTNVVSVTVNGSITKWKIETGEKTPCFDKAEMRVNSACYTPCGNLIVSTGVVSTGKIEMWNGINGEVIHTFENSTNYEYRTCSPCGKFFMATSFPSVCVWSTVDGALVHSFNLGRDEIVTSARYSPCGRFFVLASADGQIRMRSSDDGRVIRIFAGYECVCSAEYSPCGRFLVSVISDGTIRIWSIETGTLVRVLNSHNKPLISASYSPCGEFIVSVIDDGVTCQSFMIMGSMTGEVITTICAQNEVGTARYCLCGKHIIATHLWADVRETVWNIETGEVVDTYDSNDLISNSGNDLSPCGRFRITIFDHSRLFDGTISNGFIMIRNIETAPLASRVMTALSTIVLGADLTGVIFDEKSGLHHGTLCQNGAKLDAELEHICAIERELTYDAELEHICAMERERTHDAEP